jgi:hypothetical protein
MSLRGRFRIAGLVAIAALAAAAIAAHGAAGASTSTPVSGTFTVTDPGTTTCATNGAPFILRCETTGFTIQYSGSLTGTSIIDFGGIINCKTSTGVAVGTETFTGSVAGVGSGSLTWKKTAVSGIDCATGELFDFSGRGDITAGTGDLAGLNGTLEFGPDIYSGELH